MEGITEETLKAFKESTVVNAFLNSETAYFSKLSRELDSNDPSHAAKFQYLARTVLKGHLALIEAMMFQLKQVTLSIGDDRLFDQLEPEEVLALKDQSYEVQSNGKVKLRSKHHRFLANLTLTFSVFSKVFAPEYKINKTSGWNDLLELVEIRNRMTHPRNSDSLTVSAGEWKKLVSAATWFDTEVNELMSCFRKQHLT